MIASRNEQKNIDGIECKRLGVECLAQGREVCLFLSEKERRGPGSEKVNHDNRANVIATESMKKRMKRKPARVESNATEKRLPFRGGRGLCQTVAYLHEGCDRMDRERDADDEKFDYWNMVIVFDPSEEGIVRFDPKCC